MARKPKKAKPRPDAVAKAPTPEPVDELTTAEYVALLNSTRVVGNAVLKLAHKHAAPNELRAAWSRVSLWLEDNA